MSPAVFRDFGGGCRAFRDVVCSAPRTGIIRMHGVIKSLLVVWYSIIDLTHPARGSIFSASATVWNRRKRQHSLGLVAHSWGLQQSFFVIVLSHLMNEVGPYRYKQNRMNLPTSLTRGAHALSYRQYFYNSCPSAQESVAPPPPFFKHPPYALSPKSHGSVRRDRPRSRRTAKLRRSCCRPSPRCHVLRLPARTSSPPLREPLPTGESAATHDNRRRHHGHRLDSCSRSCWSWSGSAW